MKEEEKEKVKRKKWFIRKWKLVLLVFLAFILSIIILVPYFYSNRFFQPIIKEAFQQLTHNKYKIGFKKVSWNILNSSFLVHDILIVSAEVDSSIVLERNVLNILELDHIIIKGIDYSSLFNGEVKLQYLGLDGLAVQMNNDALNDSIVGAIKPNIVISEILSSILIKKIQVDNFNALLLNKGDSIYQAKNVNLSVFGFYLDSLNRLVDYRKPLFDSIELNVEQSEIQGNKSNFLFSNFTLSAGLQFRNPEFYFSDLNVLNVENGNSTIIKKGEISFGLNNFFDSFRYRNFNLQQINIHLELLENKNVLQNNVDIHLLIDNFKKKIEKLYTEVSIDSLSINIDTIHSQAPSQDISLSDFWLDMNENGIKSGELKFKDYQINIGFLKYLSKKSLDVLSFKSFNYSESKSRMILTDLIFKDSSNIEFDLKDVDVNQFNLMDVLVKKKVEIGLLSLNHAQLVMLKKSIQAEKNSSFKTNWDIDIKKIKLRNFNSEIEYLGLEITDCNILLDSVRIDANIGFTWPQVFKNFDIDFNRIEYNPPSKDVNLLIGKSRFQSLRGRLKTDALELSLEGSSLTEIVAKQVFVSGVDWHVLLRKEMPIILDSIVLGNLRIKSSLSLTSSTKPSLDSLFSFSSSYINMSEIQLYIDMVQQKQLLKVRLDKLSIKAEGFSFNNKELLQYKKLQFISSRTHFSTRADSNLVDINKWSLNMTDHVLWAEGIYVISNTRDTVEKFDGSVNLSIPRLYISGIQPLDFYLYKTVIFDSVNITHPKVRVDFEKRNKHKNTFEESLAKLQQIAMQFNKVSFNHFKASNLRLGIKTKYLSNLNEIKIASMDIGISGFYIDKSLVNRMEEFLFAKDFNFQLSGYSQNINNGQFIINLKGASVSKSKNEVLLHDFRFMSLAKNIKNPLNIYFEDVELKDFSLDDDKFPPSLSVSRAYFNKSDFKIHIPNKEGNKQTLEDLNLYPFISEYLSSLEIDDLHFRKMDLSLYNVQIAHKKIQKLTGIEIQANRVRLDSTNRLFNETKFFYSDRLLINLPVFEMKSKDQLYRIGFSNISFNSQLKTLLIDSLQINPIYEKKIFSAYLKYQKDWLEILVPQMKFENFDLREIILDKKYNINKITLNKPDIAFYKDKTIAVDTTDIKYMPAQMIAELPFYLNIDTVEIVKGKLQYEELSSSMPQPGFVNLNELNSRITGITNDSLIRHSIGYLNMTMNAQLMSKSMLTLNSSFSLTSPNQEFNVIASMGPIMAVEFNPLIQPLTLINAKDGYFKQMQMNVHGDEKYGTGNMILRYSDLKIEVLKKKNLKESQLISFLANTIFLKSKNKSIFGPRKGPIYFERVKYRGVINYITHFAIIGAKTSVGIDTRKTKKKIKSLNE